MSSISSGSYFNLLSDDHSNSCCASFFKGMTVADKVCTYVPVVSTLSNGTDLGIKFFLKILTSCHCVSKESIAKNHYLSHITKRSKVRCVVAMLPFLGNTAIATYDVYKKCKNHHSPDNNKGISSSGSKNTLSSYKDKKNLHSPDNNKGISSNGSKNTLSSYEYSDSSSEDIPNFNELLAATNSFYTSRNDNVNRLTLKELKAIYDELQLQAKLRIAKGETDFEIKINPKKEQVLSLYGIHHSAGLTVRGGKIELDNMRIHLKTELGRGAERKVEGAITFAGTLLAHPKLLHKKRQGGKVVLEGQTKRELEFQKTLKHPNIMELNHARDKGHGVMPGIYNEILPNSLKLVTPYANYFERRKKIATQLAGVASGLAYCHNRGFYHRDVKKDNVAVSERDVGKLIDLGLMTQPVAGGYFDVAGTLDYLSPNAAKFAINPKLLSCESLKEHYEIQDCWALACLIFECLHESVGDGTTTERLPLAIQHAGNNNNYVYVSNLSNLNFNSNSDYINEIKEFAREHGEVGRLVHDTFMAGGVSAENPPKAVDFAAALQNYPN